MMKLLKQLLVMVFVGLLTMSGATLGDDGQMNGPNNGADNDTGQGTQERGRDGSCDGLLGVTLEGDQDRNRDGTGCGGEPGPNQNPDPGYGAGK